MTHGFTIYATVGVTQYVEGAESYPECERIAKELHVKHHGRTVYAAFEDNTGECDTLEYDVTKHGAGYVD